MTRWPLLLALALCEIANAQPVYRWVDEQGRVHYSDAPPAKAKATEIPCPQYPSGTEAGKARREAQRPERRFEATSGADAKTPADEYSTRFDPAPVLASSDYMRTISASVGCNNWRNPQRARFSFSLVTQLRPDIPSDAVLEANFEDPMDPKRPLTVSLPLGKLPTPLYRRPIRLPINSPSVDVIRCRNYEVTINVLRNEQSRDLLGTHRQLIQSRIDSDVLKAYGEEATQRYEQQGHLCP